MSNVIGNPELVAAQICVMPWKVQLALFFFFFFFVRNVLNDSLALLDLCAHVVKSAH